MSGIIDHLITNYVSVSLKSALISSLFKLLAR